MRPSWLPFPEAPVGAIAIATVAPETGKLSARLRLVRDEADDHALMARVADGDAAAFRMLVERHAGSLSGHAARMLRSPSEAEEVVQEAYIRLWKQAPRYRAEAKLRTWLYGVVHNLCIDRLRARRPQDAEAVDGLSVEDRPSLEIGARERSLQVQREVAALPERQRAALSLVHFEELSNIDAASLMGVSVEAIESLLSRARRTLRERLAELME